MTIKSKMMNTTFIIVFRWIIKVQINTCQWNINL